jgi:hypothetical protein
LIASMVWLGVAIALVLSWKLEWRDQSKVVSPPAASTGSHEIPANEDSQVLLDSQDTGKGTASIVGLEPKTGDFGRPEIGQEKAALTRDEVATNSATTSLGRIHLLVLPSYALMEIDGGPAVSLSPYLDLEAGQHQLTFTASGFDPQTVSVLVPAGGRRNVSTVLEPASPPVLKLGLKSPKS